MIVAVKLQEITGYQFSDPLNACSALVASILASDRIPGYNKRSGFTKPHHEGNKKLALLGDAVLRLVLAERGYDHDSYKGMIQATISSVLSNKNLNMVGRRNGIHTLVVTEVSTCGFVSDNMVATAVEATFGAVYVDSNRDVNAVKEVMRKLEIIDR